jgi:hypothetical protein
MLHRQDSSAKAHLVHSKLAFHPRVAMEDHRKANILRTVDSVAHQPDSSFLITKAVSEVRKHNSHLNKAASVAHLCHFKILARFCWDYRLRAMTLVRLHRATQAETPTTCAVL